MKVGDRVRYRGAQKIGTVVHLEPSVWKLATYDVFVRWEDSEFDLGSGWYYDVDLITLAIQALGSNYTID